MEGARRVSAFPSLSDAEFERACEQLCEAYERTRHLQREWSSIRLEKHALRPAVLHIRRVAEQRENAPSTPCEDIDEEHEVNESDEEALITSQPQREPIAITYNIVLSPVYLVPVLYFSVESDSSPHVTNMDLVYQHVVPDLYKHQIGALGVIGGISMTNHPITSSPVYHVHPCETRPALEAVAPERPLSPLEYLELWIGLVGACIGLRLPVSLALAIEHV